MAVLCEGLSVVIRRNAIGTRFVGGMQAFFAMNPNRQTFCMDDDLVRVGFLGAREVTQYTDMLVQNGLLFVVDDRFVDVAVVDMQSGVVMDCRWLRYTRIPYQDGIGRLPVCWYVAGGIDVGTAGGDSPLVCPEGWEYRGSLSESFRSMPNRH